MELKFEPIKNQKFNIGRTINPFNCDCKDCNFLHCPKNNYAVKMQRVTPSFEDFWKASKETILSVNPVDTIDTNFPNRFHLNLDLQTINDMMECFKFPSKTYWSSNHNKQNFISEILIEKMKKDGTEVVLGRIDIYSLYKNNYDMSDAQCKLCDKIITFLNKLKLQILSNCKDNNQEAKA